MFRKSLLILITATLLASCIKTGLVLPSATGTRFEILVVMDDAYWKAPSGRALIALLDQDMPALPQPEPMLSIIHCQHNEFGDILKPTRNILMVEIDSRFEKPAIQYGKNSWSQPQSTVKIQAANDDAMVELLKQYGQKILDYFIVTERERQILMSRNTVNLKAKQEVEKLFGIQVDIPSELSKTSHTGDFYWATNDHARTRKDLVIYSYPYTDKNTFTEAYLIAKRDSIMKQYITGELAGSYMGTELVHAQPILKEINLNQTYCMEMKGLWRMFGGASMGGPFFSHTRVDEINKRVITVEGFVFAPGTKKRNHIRQMEAVVYTVKLPQEINEIHEVSVVATKH